MQSITVTINQSVMARQRQTPLNVRFAEEVDILSFRGNFEKAVSYKLQTKRDQVQQQSCEVSCEETSQESMKWNESLTIDEVFKPGSCTSIGSSGGSSNNRGRWNKKFGKNGSSGTMNGGGGSSSNSNHIAQWTKKNGKTGSGGSSVGCSGGASTSNSTSNSNSNRGQWTKKFKLLDFSSEKINKTVHE